MTLEIELWATVMWRLLFNLWGLGVVSSQREFCLLRLKPYAMTHDCECPYDQLFEGEYALSVYSPLQAAFRGLYAHEMTSLHTPHSTHPRYRIGRSSLGSYVATLLSLP